MGRKKFWVQKELVQKCKVQKNWVQYIFGKKMGKQNSTGPKNLGSTKLLVQKTFGQTKIGPKKLLVKKKLGQKSFWVKNFWGVNKNVG